MKDPLRIDPNTVAEMKSRGGTWAVYENHALDSANVGHLQFLKVGEGCTYKDPPKQYPVDTEHGTGWRYQYIGMLDFDTMTVDGRAVIDHEE